MFRFESYQGFSLVFEGDLLDGLGFCLFLGGRGMVADLEELTKRDFVYP